MVLHPVIQPASNRLAAVSAWLDAGVAGHHARRYGAAVLATGFAWAVSVALSPVASYSPLLLFAAAVAIAARYGGRGPALLASLLSVIAIDLVFLQPTSAVELTHPHPLLRLGVFLVVALTISSMSSALHDARRAAERHAERLEKMNVELEQQMEEVQTLSEQLQETNDSLVIARDVAEGLAKRAQAAAQAREDVLGVVAHDLRNPLNVVSMTTQLFLEIEPSREARLKLLGAMQRAVRQMNRLIGDLLEVVRLESGRLGLDLREAQACDILMQAKELCEQSAAESAVVLEIRPVDPGLRVRADTGRVLQVLGNLVGNALKFAGSGGRVTLSAAANAQQVVFSVADTGPGIAPEEVARLFDRFWQARTDRRGVGLGLTIARGIVEAHCGRIWVESRVGDGATFYFTLSAATGSSPDAMQPQLATEGCG
jgi:signal transduction histidine kinase